MKKLRLSGHKLAVSEPRYPEFYQLVKQQVQPPEVFLVECGTLSSHAREACGYLKTLAAYRNLPFVLFNVRKEDEEKTREKVPGAIIVPANRIEAQLAELDLTPAKPA